jgi:hypothetical protein
MDKFSIGFMSYVRFDDEHENGRLTEICKRLSGEVRFQTGEQFNIFQDRFDIKWGQQWRSRIDECLDAGTFLIPIITPRFFKSEHCRYELERFLARENELGRNDLILPLYYVNCSIINDASKRNDDNLAKLISERNYFDWRELRFEPFDSPQSAKMVAKLAMQITEAIENGIPESGHKPCTSAALPGGAHSPAVLTTADEDADGRTSDTVPHDTLKPENRTRPKRLCMRKRMGYATREKAPGLVEGNDVNAKPDGGVQLGKEGNLGFRRNDLYGTERSAVSVASVHVSSAGNPKSQPNGIFSPRHEVIWVTQGGRGVFEENDLRKNLNGVWETSSDATFK